MSSFQQQIKRFADKYQKDARKVAMASILDISSDIIMRTPVGNPDMWSSKPPPGYTGGTARNNWIPTIGNPSQETLAGVDKSGGATISKVQGQLGHAYGNVFYLVNNLPYIIPLEYGLYNPGPAIVGGYSYQAPQGMVRIAIRNWNTAITKAIRS